MVFHHACVVARGVFPVLLILLASTLAVQAQDTGGKAPVPDAAAQEAALKVVGAVYGKERDKAKTAAQKRALAKKLLQDGIDTKGDPSSRFVLLRMARDLAIEAGDGLTGFAVIDEMAKTFQVNAVLMKTEVLSKFAKKAGLPMQRRSIALQAFVLIDQAVMEDDFPIARHLGGLAATQARKARFGNLTRGMQTRVKEIEGIAKAYGEVKSAAATLEQNPVDPEANLAVGKYLCLLKGDWEKGGPMLALGTDAALTTVALKELRGAASHAEEVELGDAWWELAGKEKGMPRRQLMARAGHWYRRALPSLSGLALGTVKKRLAQIFAETAPQFMYLADMKPEKVRVHGSVRSAFTVGGSQVPHGLWAHSAARNSLSCISYNLREAFRELSGVAAIADSADKRLRTPQTFRIVGDGQLLWKSRPLVGRADAQPFQVDISGVELLELFVDCPGDWHYAHAVWVEPVVNR